MGVHARAAVTPADGTLVVEDLVLPDPAPYQVVVRLFASGICHSQLTDMKYSQATNSPMTLGHEATGEIVAVGSSVTTTGVGDRVFVTWLPRDGGPLGRRPDSPVLTRTDGSTTTCHNVFTWADHTICATHAAPPQRTGGYAAGTNL
jgi:threonine dehydrogenase-like Zn-dependent dehydrogenase